MTFEEVCAHIPFFKDTMELGSSAEDLYVFTYVSKTAVTLSDDNKTAEYSGRVSTKDTSLWIRIGCIFSFEKINGVWQITGITYNINGEETVLPQYREGR